MTKPTKPLEYHINDTLSKRISVLKFVLAVLIVYLHSSNLAGTNFEYGTYYIEKPFWMEAFQIILSDIIASAAVPLLFLISGFLLYAKPFTWWDNLKKKAKTVLFPFLFWNTAWIVFFLIAQSTAFGAPYFGNPDKYVAGFSPLDWLLAYFPLKSSEVFCAPFWFLSDLFRLSLIALPLKKLIDRLPALCLPTVFLLWLFNVELYFIRAEALLFYMLGYYIVKYRLSVKRLDAVRWIEILPLYACTIAAELLCEAQAPILHHFNILFGILFFIKLSLPMVRNAALQKKLLWLSHYSFFIYVTHEYTMSIFKKMAVIYLPRVAAMQMVSYLLLPVLIITLCILLGALLNKLLPRFYLLITGGR